MSESPPFRCGLVTLVGRPNTGKSTLLNRLVGQKVSITARRPQTTRHRILGIKSLPAAQIVFIDTPGLHLHAKRAMNRYLNRTAGASLSDADVVVFVVEGTRWTEEDEAVLERLKKSETPVILAVNKVDKIRDKSTLLPHLEALAKKMEFVEIIPLSARTGGNVGPLETALLPLLPESPALFPEEQVTDRSERFLAAELVREKLTRYLGQELPYALSCEVEDFKQDKGLLRIHVVIWVERPGQKAIVIGKDGKQLKHVGQEARMDMERMFGQKVFLRLWVRIKEGWSDDDRALKSLGYE